ncbi:MAG: amino acid ABC transporter ATP-binding protein [Candidatus Obscuribacter sp.]|nr:amino acid ABC transporter ATP-binding protein [Candidatus Obscuribacter sp.]MBK9277451.1 amino acid ABC transporter ATP-binding protein [Candidatus Obscuribacter sp.]
MMNEVGRQLEAVGLVRERDGRRLLDDVSLSVRPGQITALIGPSGAGKTSLLKALSLLDNPDKGKVIIDGKVFDFPLARGQKIATPWPELTVVFQQFFLWPHLTLRQNITLPLQKRRKSNYGDYLEHLIESMDLKECIDRYPNETSLGQKQRTALLRALALQPKYILLDEITSALDVEQVAGILSELKRLKQQGIGMLLVTHLLHFAREAADNIVFLESGKVLESGGKNVLDSPVSQRVKDFVALAEYAS